MSPDNHRRHASVTSLNNAREVLDQINDGCVDCLLELCALPDPSMHLVELARVAEWEGYFACPLKEEILSFRLMRLEATHLIDIAAHCAHCDSCWRQLTTPAMVNAAAEIERESERRAAARIETATVAAMRRRALAFQRQRLRNALSVTLGVAAVAASVWWLLTPAPRPRPTLREEDPLQGVLDGRVGPDPAPLRSDPNRCTVGIRRACPVPDQRGPCAVGLERCVDGGWTQCMATTSPDVERCDDGVDNDCDGEIDEGCSCRGDLTDLLAPADVSRFALGSTVDFQWMPISCPTRDVLFRIRDLTTQALVVPDVATSGQSHRLRLAGPGFVAGHEYRWTVRVIARGAPQNEYAAQFRRFTIR